jgi:formate/nitrite transporter FocA (FNT family)
MYLYEIYSPHKLTIYEFFNIIILEIYVQGGLYMKAILAGLMIGIGGMVYLSVGGPIGAALFATGLLTILLFKFELFTGKAGLLATRDIGSIKLAKIWGGNWIGCFLAAALCSLTEPGYKIAEAAAAIIQVRISNEWY